MTKLDELIVRLNDEQAVMLKMFGPETYGIALPSSRTRRSLEMRGLIEWMPPKFGSQIWAITERGRTALRARKAQEGGE